MPGLPCGSEYPRLTLPEHRAPLLSENAPAIQSAGEKKPGSMYALASPLTQRSLVGDVYANLGQTEGRC